MKQSLLSWRPGSRTSSACRRASPSARLSDIPCHPPGRPQSLGSPAAPVRSVCPVPAATPRWSLRAPMLLEGHHLLSRGPKMQPPSRGRPGPRRLLRRTGTRPCTPPPAAAGRGEQLCPPSCTPARWSPPSRWCPAVPGEGDPNGCGGVTKPLCPPPPFGDHTPPSSQSSMASSGSEQTKKLAGGRNTCKEEGSGMKDVPSWLESLGLQKYTALFSQMTYEEMMRLTEHHLESQNVPRGARQRILLSIQNLRERPSIFKALEKRILWGGSLWPVLQELQQIIVTPIKAFRPPPAAPHPDDTSDRAPPGATNAKDPTAPVPDGDIPGQFTRVMGKVCAQLLESRPYKKYITSYLQLLEQCLSHEAFTETQKKRLRCCGGKVQWLLRTFPLGADQQLAPGPACPPPGWLRQDLTI
ncbi:protein Smaug homolog 2-like isoform X2 [Athene noctua]|uniref:protein Smaug homolog 2-like isoform X2 n=1 Tax=Athene noctua TaxID=126797 RepID=UPI003EC0F920